MFELLLLPFMCLSMANESATSSKKYVALNEITSYTAQEQYKTADYENEWQKTSLTSNLSVYEYKEVEGSNGNNSVRYAEELPVTTDGQIVNGTMQVIGSLSSADKLDMFYFCLPDRTNIWANFVGAINGVSAAIYSDNPHDKIASIFELGSKRSMSPNLFLPKGAYYLKVENPDGINTEYTVALSFVCVTNISRDSVTINDDFVSKDRVLVWESDFLPKNSDPVDDTTLYAYSTGRTSPGYRVYSAPKLGSLSYDGVYRYTLLWTKKNQEELRKVTNELTAILDEKQGEIKNGNIVLKVVSAVTDALGYASLTIGIFSNAAATPFAVLNAVGTVVVSALGINYSWNYQDLKDQLERYNGALDGASPGTAIFIREDAYIKKNTVRHTHGSIVTYKLKFRPHVESVTFSPVLRRINEDAVKLDDHLNDISDCCGTFKFYDSLADIPSLYSLEAEAS